MNRYYQYCNENNILVRENAGASPDAFLKKRKPIQCNEILNQNIIISIND
jgi:hypothetical protein